ncbi:MAG: glycosyltransferase family 2 protein [Alphaproteobacteria bacterium]|nr:glycosyltransferase family 2 protein [Alphaproteobacteria bacterium]
MTETDIDVSFVFPCLNEEKTMELCVNELLDVIKNMKAKCEIIISDNGSTDNSLNIAKKLPVRVVNTPQKGYGSALRNGFEHAKGKYIAFADIDGSYPLKFLPQMYEAALKEDADMVIASRMTGEIEKNAMPWLHRHIGTPILTMLINLFFKGKLTDCNSGFRLMKKTAYESWNTTSDGMEFASELLIKALKNKAKMVEIPAGLRVDKRSKVPHLNTWKDGMRHLLFILSECPRLFENIGFILLVLFSLIFGVARIFSPLKIGNITFLNYHTQIVCIIFATLGMQLYMYSSMLYVLRPKEKPRKVLATLLDIKEDRLLFLIFAIFLLVGYGVIKLFYTWIKTDFQELNMLYDMLLYVYLVSVLSSGAIGLLGAHIVKKVLKKNC